MFFFFFLKKNFLYIFYFPFFFQSPCQNNNWEDHFDMQAIASLYFLKALAVRFVLVSASVRTTANRLVKNHLHHRSDHFWHFSWKISTYLSEWSDYLIIFYCYCMMHEDKLNPYSIWVMHLKVRGNCFNCAQAMERNVSSTAS